MALVRATNSRKGHIAMVEESDGVEEAFEGQVRVLVSAGSQVGERFARAREDALRRAQASSEQEARELQSRIDAERGAARAEFSDVHRDQWWDNATPEQIGHTYQVARAWTREDPEAARAEKQMRDELRTRYGIDAESTSADPRAVQAAIERAEQERTAADEARNRAAADDAETQLLMQQAEQHAEQDEQRRAEARAAAEHEPDAAERVRAASDAEQSEAAADRAREGGRVTYDSAERREIMATDLHARGVDSETVATRMHADVSQAKPATEAAAAGGAQKSGPPKARRGRGRSNQVQHGGPSR